MTMDNSKAQPRLPETATPGESIHFGNEKTRALTGIYAIELRAAVTNIVLIRRVQPEPLFFTVPPTLAPGEYEVRGSYEEGSSVTNPHLGHLRIVPL